MTRPKVPDEKRQRTAQACDICKRRKQKCNGKKPCATCLKRNLNCTFTPSLAAIASGHVNTNGRRSPARRRFMQDVSSFSTARAPGYMPGRRATSTLATPSLPPNVRGGLATPITRVNDPRKLLSQQRGLSLSVPDLGGRARQNTGSELDEEAEDYGQMRMLQDPMGRLLYVGDSATLSYLQLIRMIVDNSSGPSSFTMDPSRFKIMEAAISLPKETPFPHILPDRETASILIEAYFTNTSGLVDVLDRRKFEEFFDICYTNPLEIDNPSLCLLHLTFAIGLVMATPRPNSREEAIINALRSEASDRAEIFFRAAKSLGDPVTGFEDADLWSVQALSLMSIYMLAVSKRNASYAYYGMAVRTAFALGLHRVREVPMVFPEDQVTLRRNIWRSLFVLDRFLSASLGRPAAISEEDCSEGSLDAPLPLFDNGSSTSPDNVSAKALDAAVKACQSIGQILKKVYSKRRISTSIAQEIADDCDKWMRISRPELDTKRLFDRDVSPAHGLAIVHVHLFNFHSTILLSRPFFLYLLIKTLKAQPQPLRGYRRPHSKLEKFAEACVTASIRTILLVRAAHRANYLPQRNPFVLYFLFAAILIILSNEFAGLYRNTQYESLVISAIDIMTYCSRSDIQATRLLFIIESFHSVVQHSSCSATSEHARPLPMILSERSLTESMGLLSTRSNSFLDQHIINGRRHSSATMRPSCNDFLRSYSTAPMPSLETTSGPRPFPPKSSPTISSTSSHAGLILEHGQFKTEIDPADSLGGEHEFGFDSFWEMQAAARLQIQSQYTPQQARAMSVSHSTGITNGMPTYGSYNGNAPPAISQGQQHSASSMIIPGTPMYAQVNL